MKMTEEKKLTGCPSIDKPWRKYYSKDIPAAEDPECSMWEFLQKCNRHQSNNTALNYFGRRITYKELFDHINSVARSLGATGVKQGDIVSVCPLNTPEFIYLFYAINKLGAVSNLIGLTSPVSDLHEQLANTSSRIVFTVSLAYEQIMEAARDTKVEKIINVPIEASMPAFTKAALTLKNRRINRCGIAWQDFLRSSGSEPDTAQIDPNDMALIAYTGGSTGVPKGVMLSNKAMNSYYVNFAVINGSGITPYKEKEKFLFGVPLFLAFGASTCCHGSLCHSLELIMAPDPSPQAGAKIIVKSKADHIIAGRLLIEELVETAEKKRINLSFIRSIMYGGEETNKAWENSVTLRLRNHHAAVPLLNGYGMTETSAAILVAPDNETNGLIPFGNVNVKIVDPDDETKEYGYDTEGELCLSADTLMNGYFGTEEETKAVVFEDGGVRWLKTHDLAMISPDGVIRITGRIKRIYSRLTSDRIQVRVYPMRIEEAIGKCDGVEKCAVVGVKDEVLAYRTVAFIILSDKSIDKDEVRKQIDAYCMATLPDSHQIDEYIFADKFPITRAGKTDYRALEKLAKETRR